jgi:hypothetical protein
MFFFVFRIAFKYMEFLLPLPFTNVKVRRHDGTRFQKQLLPKWEINNRNNNQSQRHKRNKWHVSHMHPRLPNPM